MLASEGDEISVGKEDPEMPGWFWCADAKGIEMWVPITYITIEGKKAKFTQDYCSREIEVELGETVQYLGETLGWTECLDSAWKYGWIPSDKLTSI
jgi:hypothetical protein